MRILISIIVLAAGGYGLLHYAADGLLTKDPTAIKIMIACSITNTAALYGLFYTPDKLAQKRREKTLARQRELKRQHDEDAANRLANM